MTLDILICTFNKRIVRVPDLLQEPNPKVHYIISFQYNKPEALDLIPDILLEREDVTLLRLEGSGLSENRNNALRAATADLVYFVDDDVRFLPTSFHTIFSVFKLYPEGIDIALFQAQTYTGKDLRIYDSDEGPTDNFRDLLNVLTIEMVCRREKVQGSLSFDPRFGLSAPTLTCYEQQIWLEDALRRELKICYVAQPIIQTSAIYVPRMISVDPSVQRSFGALLYYVYGTRAYLRAIGAAVSCAHRRFSHFLPILRHIYAGIAYIRSTPEKRNK